MTKEVVFEDLKTILSTVKPSVRPESLTPESRLVEDLAIDSLSILLMSISIENKYGFQFEGVPQFKTVGDVIDHIIGKTA